LPSGVLLRFRHDRLGFILHTARRYGDIAYFTLMGWPVYLVSHPDLVQAVLEVEADAFAKGRGLGRARRLLGQGLLTSEGLLHQRQRRLVLPAFHRERMTAYGEVMVDHASALQARWLDGETRDIAADMQHLTRSIVAKTLFDFEVTAHAQAIDAALATLVGSFGSLSFFLPEWVLDRGLWPSAHRLEAARAELDDLIYRMIHERRASGRDHGDLLSMLLGAVDEDGDGEGMTDRQVRDEVMTLFLAGHETTANALTWTWLMLSKHPEARASVLAELDDVITGRPPAVADVPSLPFTRAVLHESIRRYPPAWAIGRRATADLDADGHRIAAGSVIVVSPWLLHHDPRWWDEPWGFRPERWLADDPARPRDAYVPFGAGPRMCIGEGFAWLEATLVLATIVRRLTLSHDPTHRVELQPAIALRPRTGMPMTVHRR
jgi:cytochrome P450